jgi:hypothetical protein
MSRAGARRVVSEADGLLPDVAEFLNATFAAFDDASRECGQHARLQVAGHPIQVRYAAPHLHERFRDALPHLSADTGPADFTICCWDGTATASSLPPPPWPRRDFIGLSRVRGHITGPLIVTYDADGGLLQMYDRMSRRALFYVRDGERLPDWHDRAPFRSLISLWADDRHLALLHAATVASAGTAVCLAGRSGDGKSTSALSCVAAGLEFLSDDACLVDPTGPTVSALFGRAKLQPDAATRLDRFVDSRASAFDSAGGIVVTLRPVAAQARVAAIVRLRLDLNGPTTLSECLPPERAFDALLDTIRPEAGAVTPAALRALGAVVHAVPVRELRIGGDDGLVGVVRDLLT